MILREKVQEIPKPNLPWQPLASDLTMDNVKKVVPCELYNMLRILFRANFKRVCANRGKEQHQTNIN